MYDRFCFSKLQVYCPTASIRLLSSINQILYCEYCQIVNSRQKTCISRQNDFFKRITVIISPKKKGSKDHEKNANQSVDGISTCDCCIDCLYGENLCGITVCRHILRAQNARRTQKVSELSKLSGLCKVICISRNSHDLASPQKLPLPMPSNSIFIAEGQNDLA